MIKGGDKLVCVKSESDPFLQASKLVVGKIYIVKKNDLEAGLRTNEGVFIDKGWYRYNYLNEIFMPLKEYRKQKLNKILCG